MFNYTETFNRACTLDRDLSIWHQCPRKLAGAILCIRYNTIQLPVTETQRNLFTSQVKFQNGQCNAVGESCPTKSLGNRFLLSCSAIHRFSFPTSAIVQIGSSTHILKGRKEIMDQEKSKRCGPAIFKERFCLHVIS